MPVLMMPCIGGDGGGLKRAAFWAVICVSLIHTYWSKAVGGPDVGTRSISTH